MRTTATAPPAVGLAVFAALTLTVATAHAQHEHHHMDAPPAGAADAAEPTAFQVDLSLVGATFDQMLYEGDYAGVGVGASWRYDRLSVHAAVRAYHLTRNGAAVDGIGDVTAGVDVLAYQRGTWSAGAGVSATLPTGEQYKGLGMGHPMLMPAAWAGRDDGRTMLGVSLGWCGAIGGGGTAHDHGPWPIVEPMSESELMGGVHLDRVIRGPFHAGVGVLAALPLHTDPTRVVAAIGGGWRHPRAETGVELQAGLAGDPFTVRGLVTSSLRF
ncbi:MAG TPA: hypothetical protein VHE35_00505 [Kofleriaceae bacterium]|nr:hypothetical protein [Kofleriaceae bacterium]